MIKLPQIESNGYDGVHLTYEGYRSNFFHVTGWQEHDLGATDWDYEGDSHVYGYSLGDLNTKHVLLFIAGTHGNEHGTCYGLPYFMQGMITPPPACRALVDKLKAMFAWFVIPVLNPWGFEFHERVNVNSVNLNRNYDYKWAEYVENPSDPRDAKGSAPFSEKETQMVKNVVETYKPIVALDMHSHGRGLLGMHINTPAGVPEASEYEILLDTVSKSMVFQGTNKQFLNRQYAPEYTQPSTASWASAQTDKRGKRIISCTPEIGDGTEPDDTEQEARRKQSVMAANMAFLVSVCTMIYFRKGVVKIEDRHLREI